MEGGPPRPGRLCSARRGAVQYLEVSYSQTIQSGDSQAIKWRVQEIEPQRSGYGAGQDGTGRARGAGRGGEMRRRKRS